jgi:hypothetical protein
MPSDTIPPADEDGENAADGPKAPAAEPKSPHQTMMDGLSQQIALLKKMNELETLEAERDEAERELKAQRERETPEGKARERLAAEIKKRRERREAEAKQQKETRAQAKADANEEQEERDKQREALAKQLKAQLKKTRVGELKLREAPDDFKPEELRDFTKDASIYDLEGVEIKEGKEADFFALTEEQAQDLYERIGANRGVVFDPTQGDAFHLGFRPVLRGPVTQSALEDDLREQADDLSDTLGQLEAEQTVLEYETKRWAAPKPGEKSASAVALEGALARKEKIKKALAATGGGERSRYELILQERIRLLDAEDEAIELPATDAAPRVLRDQALAEARRLRGELSGKVDLLQKQFQGKAYGPLRGALLTYVQGVREKVAEAEKLERRIGEKAEHDARKSLHYLVQQKRAALDASLVAALNAEKLAGATPAQQADEIRDALVDLDRQWISVETTLRTEAPEASKALIGLAALAELLAAVDSTFEGQVDEQVQDLRKQIRTLSEAWIEALKDLLPDLDQASAEIDLDARRAGALDAVVAEHAVLEKVLSEVEAASQIAEVRAVQEGLGALEREWQRTLADDTIKMRTGSDPAVARTEARDVVRRELQRELRKASDARAAEISDEENRLREEIGRVEAWCEELSESKRLADVAADRLELKKLEVEEARAKLNAVQTALGRVLETRQNRGMGASTLPARIYFRKPEVNASFENKFTSSEIEAQALSSGIDTTDFRVNAAFTSVWVSGGSGYGRSSEESRLRGSASSSRTIYITSSFSLPKVELSLPLEHPCASDEFLGAVRGAIAEPEAKAERLLYVLREFGHFIPRRLTVGGKLYSTEEREIKGNETASQVAKKRADEVQASISVTTPWVGGGAETKYAWGSSTLDSETQKSLQEAQTLILNAVGGEGGYVKDVGRWSASLQSYTRWQTINMTSLFPSIGVLPDKEREECKTILGKYVREYQQTLASKRGALFLFYSGYAEMVGLRPSYFYLRNLAGGAVLSLSSSFDRDGVYAVKAQPAHGGSGQLWTISPEGYLLSQHRRDRAELALTLKGDAKTVVAVPPDPANVSQIWDVSPRGPITGRVPLPPGSAGDKSERLVLRTEGADGVIVEKVKAGATLTSFYQWAVVSEDEMNRLGRLARVVYRSGQKVIELSLDKEGAWSFDPLTANLEAANATGRPFAYTTANDGVQRVVYVDESGHVQELWLPPDRPWTYTDLTELTKAPKAAGDPFGYFGGKTARTLYRDTEGYIRELYIDLVQGWCSADLANRGTKIKGNPFAFVTGSIPRVIFRDPSDEIWEVRLEGSWLATNLSQQLPGKPKPDSDLFGYVADSMARVVFRVGTEVREIYRRAEGNWSGGDYNVLTGANAAGDPVGFMSADGKTAQVVYRDTAGHLQLLYLAGKWEKKDLTAEASSPAAIGTPLALVTADNVMRVLYRDASKRIVQLALRPSQAKWEKTDLTERLNLASWLADSDPNGYAQ